jgi:hypothetical protein
VAGPHGVLGPERLSELWYTFRPTASFNLDTLPLTVDGRLLTLTGFRDRLSQAGKAEPRLAVAHETGHGEWVKKLENLDLDPELFRYQRAMNAREGEAADAFTFKNDEAFVDFLLRAVTDEEDPRGLADVLAGYAARLAQRGTLIAERDFVAGALERLAPLTVAAADARAAAELAQTARRDAEALAASLRARHRADAHHLDRAGRQLEQITKTENTAAAAAADTIRELVDARQEEARPALRARDLAARALARALLQLAADAEQHREHAEEQASTLDERATAADQAGQQAVRKSEKASVELAAAQHHIDQAQTALRAAADHGLLTAIDQVEQEARDARQLVCNRLHTRCSGGIVGWEGGEGYGFADCWLRARG